MKALFSRLVSGIERTPISAWEWLFGAAGILFVRFLLENFTTASASGIIASDAPTLVHYLLTFFACALALAVVGAALAPEKRDAWLKISLFGLLLTWISPLIDLISREQMAYLFDVPDNLLRDFLTFFGPLVSRGVSTGLRFEIALILIILFIFLRWYAGKSWAKSLFGAVLGYAALFIIGSMPSLIYALHVSVSPSVPLLFSPNPIADYLSNTFSHSLIAKNFLHPTELLDSSVRYFEIYFDAAMGCIMYILCVSLAALYVFLAWPEKIKSVLKNSRPERVAHYFILIVAGIVIAAAEYRVSWRGWPDILSILILFFSFYAAWMYAAGRNDIEDIATDRISNPERPLVAGSLSISEMESFNAFFLVAALLGGFLAGYYALYMVLAYILLSHIYSCRPLRLKRFPVVSSFVISLASLAALMAGYFFWGTNPVISSFHVSWAVLVVIFFTLAANIKDIKDFEGDKMSGVHTIPVMFGAEKGRRIIALCCMLALLAVPLLLDRAILFAASIPTAVFAWIVMTRDPFREKNVFALYFLFFALVAVILI
ncbi:MAG TPA: UbiA prenyltransferase family protein [Candidatus Paceibacterota bacterium]|jgi:4-hydroxybenzoate polyprenyltransferase|nr:UbiA prenyltransferase family protein [Candidatus Paceibacterota bacterium]